MRIARRNDELTAGLAAIRREEDVPDGFPPDVVEAAERAAQRRPGAAHCDRTGEAFVTLDPASSTDLDQAFTIERAGADLLLHYAIADVGFFVRPGDPLDVEAWTRGVTVYLPGEREPLYPPVLSEGAASLLPDAPRPAVVFTVRIDGDGAVALEGVERAVVHSRAKLAYDAVGPADLPPDFAELAARIVRAEDARGAARVDFPEQELEEVAGSWQLRFRPRLASEQHNAGMSLATNLAVADALHAAGTGLYRVMPEPDDGAVRRLRWTARAFGLAWPQEQSLAEFQRRLPQGEHRTSAFLLAARRASGGADYAPFVAGDRPWHAAMAATYSHATAPLRRLADRYVIEAALAVASGVPVPEEIATAFARLPDAMDRGETKANRVGAAALNLAEAVALRGREGEQFDAVVVGEDARGAVVQVCEPAVVARVTAHNVDPGAAICVRLTSVDVPTRTIHFERTA